VPMGMKVEYWNPMVTNRPIKHEMVDGKMI